MKKIKILNNVWCTTLQIKGQYLLKEVFLLKRQRLRLDCLAVRRFNCQYDEVDVDNWKRWIVDVQKPMNRVLAAALLTASVLTMSLVIYLCLLIQRKQYDLVQLYSIFPKEMLAVQIGILLLMFFVMQLGNYICSKKVPRPRLERCLEVQFYTKNFSLFYFYRKKRERILIDTFTYKLVNFMLLDENTILINGYKIQFGDPSLDSLLKPTERCKLQRSYGYLQGIRGFSYHSDVKAFIDEISCFQERAVESSSFS